MAGQQLLEKATQLYIYIQNSKLSCIYYESYRRKFSVCVVDFLIKATATDSQLGLISPCPTKCTIISNGRRADHVHCDRT